MPISYEEFSKVELKTAKVISAERVEGSDKLIRLEVDAGDKDEAGEPSRRQIVAGIGTAYEPDQLAGKNIVIVANLAPRKLMGIESQGMLLAASEPEGPPVLLTPDHLVEPGSLVK
jgi:methionyl-tRNA synthetase